MGKLAKLRSQPFRLVTGLSDELVGLNTPISLIILHHEIPRSPRQRLAELRQQGLLFQSVPSDDQSMTRNAFAIRASPIRGVRPVT